MLAGGRNSSRNDLLAAKAALDEGQSPDELANDPNFFGVVAKHHKYFKDYYASRTEARRRCPRVIVLWGDSGCGKTIHANMCDPAVTYFVPIGSSGGTWFDGYDPASTPQLFSTNGMEVVVPFPNFSNGPTPPPFM